MDADLNIDNYSLEDLLNLFKLPYDYNEHQIKQAYKIVYKLHPDKSKLDKKYFLFYMKAIKLITSIRNINKKNDIREDFNFNIDKNELEKQLKNKNFNKWFNDIFEKYNIKTDEQEGYDEWLKSNENIEENTSITMSDMNSYFQKKKQNTKEMVLYNDKKETNYSNNLQSSNLDNSKPISYDSCLFSKLPYEDLKKAHTETVVPVTDEDFNNREKFNTILEYQQHRNTQNMQPLNKNKSEALLKEEEKMRGLEDMKRAYNLNKINQQANTNNNEIKKQFNLLKN
jgi:hypothetical protein